MRLGLSDELKESKNSGAAKSASNIGKAAAKNVGKKVAKGAVKTASKAAGPFGWLVGIGLDLADALGITKALKAFVIITLSLVILMPIVFMTNANGISWNPFTHIAEYILNGEESAGEDTTEIQVQDLKYAQIVSKYMQYEYNELEEYIKAECEKKGIDYEASKENIVDNTVIPLVSYKEEAAENKTTSENNTFSEGVVNWVNETVALKKYGYKKYGEIGSSYTVAESTQCPICHPDSGDGWNCIGFAFAAWHHGGDIDSKCSCDVINDATYDKMIKLTEEEASKVASKKTKVSCKVIKNGGNPVSASQMMPGDIMVWYKNSSGGYYHTSVYVGDGEYAESTSSKSYVSTDNQYNEKGVYLIIRYTGDRANAYNGKISQSAEDVKNGACAWAEAIAGDNEFHYGEASWAHHNGCYFCGTQPGSKRNGGGDWEKSYCCNPFVHAAFAHGGGEPLMLEKCQDGSSYDWGSGGYPDSPVFQSLGKPDKSDLEKGDVLCWNGHVMLYIGDGKIAHAGSSDNGIKGSDSWNKSICVTELGSFLWRKTTNVYRYIGTGGGIMEIPNSTSLPDSNPVSVESLAKSRECLTILSAFSVYDAQLLPLENKTSIDTENPGLLWLIKEAIKDKWRRDWNIPHTLRSALKKARRNAKQNQSPAFFDILIADEDLETKQVAKSSTKVVSSSGGTTSDINKEDWDLILVNNKNAIPDGYTVTTQEVEGYEVDSRIADALSSMLSDCRAAGYSPEIISGYRTRETQQYLYDHTANKQDTAVPGHSEHECGLAVDILEKGWGSDWDNAEKTAKTETQKWLTAHCADYGFILRYPKDKEDITEIVYESWHYRYVGKEHAKRIMNSGVCLEEYLEGSSATTTETVTQTVKVAPLIEINHAGIDKVCAIFDLNPKDPYNTESSSKPRSLFGGRKSGEEYEIGDTDIETAIETNTDTHMQLLYNGLYVSGVNAKENLVLPIKSLFTKIKLSKKFAADKKGIECKLNKSYKVYACERGQVQSVVLGDEELGNFVVIEGAFQITYTHLDKINVKKGDSISQNEVIGTASKKFRLEVRQSGNPIDPEPLFIKRKFKSTHSGSTQVGVVGEKRVSAPESGNKYFSSSGGNNFPRNWGAGHGGNCTWYAFGRFMEAQGRTNLPSPGGDAYSWQYTKAYEKGQTPRPGSIIVWDYGTGTNGHAAFVEEVKSNGDIVCTESAWGSTGHGFLFSTATYKAPHYPGHGTFKCFIYPKYAVKTESSLEGGTKGDYQRYAQSLFSNYDWDSSEMSSLIKLWNKESGWNPKAENASSGAYGIPQSLPASKMASEGDDYLTNPETQIRWGLRYIKQRYGSPSAAWAFHQENNWY